MTGKSVAVFIGSGIAAAALSFGAMWLARESLGDIKPTTKGLWRFPVGAGVGGAAVAFGSRHMFQENKTAATVGAVIGTIPALLIGQLVLAQPIWWSVESVI